MKLYVCWDTFRTHPILGKHPCGIAHQALRDAGHDPEVTRVFGWKALPRLFNLTPGRREVERLTGSNVVPLLVTDEGELVQETQPIKDWARAHPAAGSGAPPAPGTRRGP